MDYVTELKGLIVKDKIDPYDVGLMLKYVAMNLFSIPQWTYDEMNCVEEEANGLIRKIKVWGSKVLEAHESLDDQLMDFCKLADARYNKTKVAIDRITKKFQELNKIPHIETSQLDRVYDLIIKMDNLTDDQWFRLIELAKALQNKE